MKNLLFVVSFLGLILLNNSTVLGQSRHNHPTSNSPFNYRGGYNGHGYRPGLTYSYKTNRFHQTYNGAGFYYSPGYIPPSNYYNYNRGATWGYPSNGRPLWDFYQPLNSW